MRRKAVRTYSGRDRDNHLHIRYYRKRKGRCAQPPQPRVKRDHMLPLMQEDRQGQMVVHPSDGAHSRDDPRHALPYVLRSIGILPPETACSFDPHEGAQDRQAYDNAYSAYDHREGVQGQRPPYNQEEPYSHMDERAHERSYVQDHRYEAQGYIRRQGDILRYRRCEA